MGMEKVASRSGGFFHLFDWNKKSKKKLFANTSISPEKTEFSRNTQDVRSRQWADEDSVGTWSYKDCSVYSCASSVTDEDGYATKAPGLVARLMGLESLPTSSVTEPYSTQFFDSSQRNLECKISNNVEFIRAPKSPESFLRKPQNQRMPSNQIERYQREILPLRRARSSPNYKLLSPIKNSRFISSEDAAHIMEVAAKMLEPQLQTNSTVRGNSLRGKTSLESTIKKPAESNVMKYPKGNSREDPKLSSAKSKGNSVSLAVQAKVNVQRREELKASSGVNKILTEECKSKPSQPLKTSNRTSGVLRQNNQKQNCLVAKQKSSSKGLQASNPQAREGLSRDATSSRIKSWNKPTRKFNDGSTKRGSDVVDHEKQATYSKTNGLLSKGYRDNIVIDEKPMGGGETKITNCTDVVSFTFNSPVKRQVSESEYSKFVNDTKMDSKESLTSLLEQKLNELTSVFRSRFELDNAAESDNTTYGSEADISSDRTSEKDLCDSSSSSINGQVLDSSPMLQMTDSLPEYSCSDAHNGCNLPQSSLISTLESSYSYETCDSAESCYTANGTAVSSSVESTDEFTSVVTETEASDSVSSLLNKMTDQNSIEEINTSGEMESHKQEIDYVMGILSAAKLNTENFPSDYTRNTLSSRLFEKLKNIEDDGDDTFEKRLLFDCVKECLDLKYQHYFSSSYERWRKGTVSLSKGQFAEELYAEMLGWDGSGDLLVDELLQKDMTSHFGRWVDFENETCQTGEEIEQMVLNNLINEVVAEFRIRR